ncbi:MAG: sigma 54-interacting transcriptional regulator [Polyangiaceae bacterium]
MVDNGDRRSSSPLRVVPQPRQRDDRLLGLAPEKLLTNVLDTMPAGMFSVDPAGRITSWNHAMEQLTGFPAREALGKDCSILNSDTCSGVACGAKGEPVCPLYQEGDIRDRRCRIQRRDGSWLSVLKNARAMSDEDGNLLGGIEVVTDLSQIESLEDQLETLRRASAGQGRFGRLTGKHPAMRRLYELVELAGRSDAAVLLQGETGTGKELVARAVFEASARKNRPFVRVSCAALTESLLESELFGHVRGAFTGAVASRVGRFEAANGGTVFLDEIGDISPAVQTKLLRVLQEKEFERVGDNRPIKVDVRFIAATNCDLQSACAEGNFRRDLFYRLAVIPIRLPSLRERRDDIPMLVDYFMERMNARQGRAITRIHPDAMATIMAYSWPGNVRELENAIEYAFAVTRGSAITVDCLPTHLTHPTLAPPTARAGKARPRGAPDAETLREVLAAHDGNRTRAAEHLGVSRVTLWKWLKQVELA